ncbi:MAG: hypothetical protein LBI42_09870, partial [Chitinispirillales bacterium]|nr:hypothetical protein [Chitinispirillales bacterium]
FSDAIYTCNKELRGYITKIEAGLKKNEIKFEVIFEPDDYSDLIIERGIPVNDLMPRIVEKGMEESGTVNTFVVEGGV